MKSTLAALFAFLLSHSTSAAAQDLVPGAYTPAPVGFYILTVGGAYHKGDLTFDPALPIAEGHATIGGGFIGVSRTLDIAGRYASLGIAAPYLLGHVQGRVSGQFQETSRSGLGDLSARIAINLYGAPALTRQQFAARRSPTIAGVSLTMGAPVGQYYPDKFINIGTNRWFVKPELGLARTRGPWTFEGDAGATFFTDNTNYVNGGAKQQAPIASAQGHLTYTIRPAFWIAGDANFWRGGRVTINGTQQAEQQQNSRVGITAALPIGRRQIRIGYSLGAYTRVGGAFHSLGVSYSYVWAAR